MNNLMRRAMTKNYTTGTRMINPRFLITGLIYLFASVAVANTLDEITFATLPGNKVQIKLSMSETAVEPGSFTIDNPARIALDFPGTSSRLSHDTFALDAGVLGVLFHECVGEGVHRVGFYEVHRAAAKACPGHARTITPVQAASNVVHGHEAIATHFIVMDQAGVGRVH